MAVTLSTIFTRGRKNRRSNESTPSDDHKTTKYKRAYQRLNTSTESSHAKMTWTVRECDGEWASFQDCFYAIFHQHNKEPKCRFRWWRSMTARGFQYWSSGSIFMDNMRGGHLTNRFEPSSLNEKSSIHLVYDQNMTVSTPDTTHWSSLCDSYTLLHQSTSYSASSSSTTSWKLR